jgi:hypothetical protein
MGKTLLWVIFAILLKSTLQYLFGSESNTLMNILLNIDKPFYIASYLGATIVIILQDNFDLLKIKINKWCYINTLKFDSDNEDSPAETKVIKTTGNNKKFTLTSNGIDSARIISGDTNTCIKSMLIAVSELKDKYNTLKFDHISLEDRRMIDEFYIPLITKHQELLFLQHFQYRIIWIRSHVGNLTPENLTRLNFENLERNIELSRSNFRSRLATLGIQDGPTQCKIAYAALNEFRNSVGKELNKAEDIIFKDLKKNPVSLYDDEKLIEKSLKEYSEAKKLFKNEDSYLRMKIGEVLNRKKT